MAIKHKARTPLQKLNDERKAHNLTRKKAVERDKSQQEYITRMGNENARLNQIIHEKNQLIVARDAEIERQKTKCKRVVTERDRVYRLTEMFLSVQITPLPQEVRVLRDQHHVPTPTA